MISTTNPTREFPQPTSARHYSSSSGLEGWIERHPRSSVLIGLGVGLGAGICLSCAIRSSSIDLSADDSFAQKLGHRVMDAFREAVPPSWREHFPT